MIRQCVEELSIGMGKLMQPLRLALAGALVGPSMPDLMDVLGKEVLTLSPNNKKASIDGSSLRTGIYFAKIQGANGSKTLKLVRQ